MQSTALHRISPRSEAAALSELLPAAPTHPVRWQDSARDLLEVPRQTPDASTGYPRSLADGLAKLQESADEQTEPPRPADVLVRFAVRMQEKLDLDEAQMTRLQAAYKVVAKHPVSAELVRQIASAVAGHTNLEVALLARHIQSDSAATQVMRLVESPFPRPVGLSAHDLSAAVGSVRSQKKLERVAHSLDRDAKRAEKRLAVFQALDAMPPQERVKAHEEACGWVRHHEWWALPAFLASPLYLVPPTLWECSYYTARKKEKRLKRSLTAPEQHALKVSTAEARAKLLRARSDAAERAAAEAMAVKGS